METLHNGFTLELSPGAFPLSTDSVALADFIKLPKSATVLDLGSGCGTLGLLLCARDPLCQVTGIELDEGAHRMALHNRDVNGLTGRLDSICGDIADLPSLVSPGSFRVCISNPPYFSGGPASKVTPIARREDRCSPDTLFRAAQWALRYGGDFFLVHRPERFAELCGCASAHSMAVKRVCLLRHKAGGPVSLILMQCRKGAAQGLIWEEAALYTPAGEPTDHFKRIYHL